MSKSKYRPPVRGHRNVDIDPIWERFLNPARKGHFEALVELADDYKPDYMRITGAFTPGVLKAELPAGALAQLRGDEKVLSVELREFVGG